MGFSFMAMARTVAGSHAGGRSLTFAALAAEVRNSRCRNGHCMSAEPTDDLLASLAVLERSLDANDERTRAMRTRIGHIRDQRLAGRAYSEIVSAEQRPLIVELLTQSVRELDGAGVHVRRHEAEALRREGMTMDGIAALFGVSRQRVSTLLRDREAPGR